MVDVARLACRALLLAGFAAALCGPLHARPARDFANIPYADWSDAEPPYRLYPGDEVEVTVLSAPELSKTVTVQPDGRIALPLIGAIMVTDRTIQDVQQTLA